MKGKDTVLNPTRMFSLRGEGKGNMSFTNLEISELSESIRGSLQGSVDFHLHSHVAQGFRWNLVEIAQQAISAGMSALMIKNLFGTSQEACHTANKHLGRTFLYPSLTLGRTTGGLNPFAVEHFSKGDPANRIVELPAFDSMHEIRLRGLPEEQGVPIFRDNKPASGLSEILEILAKRNMVLKTGHISPGESLALIPLARNAGVERIVVTHATGGPVMATPEEQKEMADMGAFIEHCLVKFLPISRLRNIKRFPNWEGAPFGDLDYLKASIESVGPDRCIAATDAGQIYNPLPVECFVYLLYLLEELGCSKEEIRMMTRTNPRELLNVVDDPGNT
jgi:hypothetical protein